MSQVPTLSEMLARTARKHPDREAIVYPRKEMRLTFRELDRRATRVANALRERGVTKGDRVALLLHNSAEFITTMFGVLRSGAIIVPVNYRLAGDEVVYTLNDVGAKMLFFEAETRATVETQRDEFETVEEYVHVDDDRTSPPAFATGYRELIEDGDDTPPDVSLSADDRSHILYTSGTTGKPKGVVHTHGDVTYFNMMYFGWNDVDHEHAGISAMPLYHSGELCCNLFPRINLGATTIVLHEYDPHRILELIDEEQVTHMFVSSRLWSELIEETDNVDDFDGSSFELGFYGSAPMPPTLLKECMETFTENWATGWGMTELAPCPTWITPDEVRDHINSLGTVAPNHEVRIVEPTSREDPDDPVTWQDTVETGEIGEIIVDGPSVMEEYWNRPEATEAVFRDGWFFTGDAGYFDEDGYLHLVDRFDSMIISGGENIYPQEVEHVLYEHEAVSEAVVVGEPDEKWGERVTAFVVAEQSVTTEELDRHFIESDRKADFKRPRKYYFAEELPRRPNGKIKRAELQAADPMTLEGIRSAETIEN